MKKNTVLYIIVFVALAVTATILVLKGTDSTLPPALTDFAYKDTASITKIVLSDHYKNVTTLQRKSLGTWMVNGKYKVDPTNISSLLETIRDVQVKSPIPVAANNSVIKDLATNGIKIDIYDGDKEVKSYYVGSPTPDDLGTLMLLQGSSQPFITWIPGFSGYLTPRYIVRVRDWRSTEIYDLSPADITSVQVKYYGNENESFTLKIQGNDFILYKQDTTTPSVSVNQLLAKRYLSGFAEVNFEAFAVLSPTNIDSMLKTTPYASITVTTTEKKYLPFILYSKHADASTKDIGKGNIDLDRFYGTIGADSKEVLLIQTHVVGKLLAFYHDLATGKASTIPGRYQ